MTHDYLADLNQEQRRAVKHGVKGGAVDSRPLLVIAGAGSGKTKTLAHRVAHLVVNGIDRHRILLLTFSRRAALDMTGRVKRITGAAMGIGQIDLPWAGAFMPSALVSCAKSTARQEIMMVKPSQQREIAMTHDRDAGVLDLRVYAHGPNRRRPQMVGTATLRTEDLRQVVPMLTERLRFEDLLTETGTTAGESKKDIGKGLTLSR
jgi:superfamily I DNA/RNA helicase